MFDKILSLVDSEAEFSNIWELRSIRFDIELDEERKSFERHVAVSYNVEDAKGNAGFKGQMFVTNLRVLWQLSSDPSINLSIGWDTIVNTSIKTMPVGGGNSFKHLLALKTQNLSQNRYEFKFMGYGEDELRVFNVISDLQKKVAATKTFRCTNLAIKCDPNYELLEGEELKSSYEECIFTENEAKIKARLVLTDVRVIILKNEEKKMNYSIPWLMVRSVEKQEEDSSLYVRIHCRGILASRLLCVTCRKGADLKKLYLELKTFSESYNKAPILGYSFDKASSKSMESVVSAPRMEI